LVLEPLEVLGQQLALTAQILFFPQSLQLEAVLAALMRAQMSAAA
jgi:hypothetical protein